MESITTFQTIVQKTAWEDVRKTMINAFPDQEYQIAAYAKVFEQLNSLPSGTNSNQLVIHIEEVEDVLEPKENYSGVFGREPNAEFDYALDFVPWEEWLGFFCDPASIDRVGEAEFVARCMFEMTFDGFDQETIQSELENLKQKIDE